jgi:hypothetical protein
VSIDVPRDRWGRPLIVPPGDRKPIAYTRASTLAKALDNGNALANWKQRMTALGLAVRPDLMALVHTKTAEDRKDLDNICEQALVAAGGEARANMGTALHALSEEVDRGIWPTADEAMMRDLTAYAEAVNLAGLRPLAMEGFVVQDQLQVAGTYDRIWQMADGTIVVGDLKTGDSAATYGLGAVQIQTAVYAHGTPYTHDAGRGKALADLGVSQTLALLVHLPAGSGECSIYPLNIEEGWADAQLASSVHRRTAAIRKIKVTPITTTRSTK